MSFYGTDGVGTFIKIAINRKINRQALVSLHFLLADGTIYQLPSKHIAEMLPNEVNYDCILTFSDAPDTLVSNTDGRDVFNAAGIKFQLNEAMRSWRIVFNGTAKRIFNGKVRTELVKFH